MKFNNRQNKPHKVEGGREVWESRSVAVVGLVLVLHEGERYVLMGKRGPALPNAVGQWCMPCGFLDWDETCEDAVVREIWEETGFNVIKASTEYNVIYDHMHYPWRIYSTPDAELQNVSLHYGIYIDTKENMYREVAKLPEITKEHNEEDNPGEVDEVRWINIKDLQDYDCAFDHDSIINIFINSLPDKHDEKF